MKIDHDLKLPRDKRHLFAEPLDILIAGTREDTIPQVVELLKEYQKKLNNQETIKYHLVGDIVAEDFLSRPFLAKHVQLCFIDEKTQRKNIEIGSKTHFNHVIEFENPAGVISKQSWQIIEEVLATQEKTLINITKGEEDLLLIPLVLLLPLEEQSTHFVFYGQPPITDAEFTIPQGIVVVKVNKQIQQKVKQLLAHLEEI
ncbi:MAG: DUF359 domain-containing protein [Promethearchaeia archaeon]